jgi:hypothetical protein
MAKLIARSVLLLSLSLAACKGDKGKGEPKYADVDCAKMLDHFSGIIIAEKTKGMSPDEAAKAKKGVEDARPTAIAQCEQEKNTTKKLTVEQYDCLMKANDAASMAACAPAE